MALFELDQVALSFPSGDSRREVLRDISLTIAESEIVTICGASGTGKTSLLRILAGLTEPSQGHALYRGVPIEAPPEGTALVFQDYSNALLQWRKVAGNVALGIESKLSQDEVGRRVAESLALVGLVQNAGDYPWQLSGGMQQRVQIARALALKPSVLLMDEPFAALDAMTKAGLQDELLRIRMETGASIVFITHDIEEAVYLGDRIAVLGGSPATLTAAFTSDLPWPREQVATRELPEFLKLRHAVHDTIRSR